MKPDQRDREILLLYSAPGTREKAFDMLYDAYAERLYWHIRRMVDEHESANDLLQECLVKVWNGLSSFRGDAALYTWLYRIASNECLNFLEKEKRRHTRSLDDISTQLDENLEADISPDGDDVKKKLDQAIQQLPDKQRLVFNMRYFEEMPYQEMSEILETSIGALKASFHHAVQKIEKFIRSAD